MRQLYFFSSWLLGWLLCAAIPGRAQQILCERVLVGPATQNGYIAAGLLQVQPDSLRLVGEFQPGNMPFYNTQPTITSVRRILASSCDTLPVRGAKFQLQSGMPTGQAITTRRGQVLISNFIGGATVTAYLRLLGRDGQTRWTRSLNTNLAYALAGGLLEAPDRGFFMSVRSGQNAYLVRLDSLGTVLWQRKIGRFSELYAPAYTRTGTLLFHAGYTKNGIITSGVAEFSQNGDSLSTHQTNPTPLQGNSFRGIPESSLQPLRDGGFLVAASVDSASTAFYRPFLTRLDRNLNVVWSTIYGKPATTIFNRNEYVFSHPFELADGSLLVLAETDHSGNVDPYWLFRYSAAGVLLQRYAFTSPLIPSFHPTGAGAGTYDPSFVAPVGLQPLSDSTFTVVDNLASYSGPTTQRRLTYLAHLKVPGLRRVIDSHYIPATNSPLATRASAATFPTPAYPNPATTTVTVPLPAAPIAGQLRLLDGLGRLVRAWPVAAGAASATLGVGGLAAGLYLLRLERAGQPAATQRLSLGP